MPDRDHGVEARFLSMWFMSSRISQKDLGRSEVMKVLKMKMFRWDEALKEMEKKVADEYTFGPMPDNFSMQILPNGKVLIFYFEEEAGAQG